jgi:hypothetical protein
MHLEIIAYIIPRILLLAVVFGNDVYETVNLLR